MTVCYFTASGNCLYVARRIGGTLLSIPQLMKQDSIEIKDDAVGIIAPCYAAEMPMMVREFLEKAKIKTDYFFFIYTYGMGYGEAFAHVELLAEKSELELAYINAIQMVDNYLPIFDMQKQIATLPDKNVEGQIENVIADIAERKTVKVKVSAATKAKMAMYSKTLAAKILKKDTAQGYIVNDSCVNCGVCAKVCPANNITATDSGVQFADRCEVCYACLHNCPQNAIHLKKQANTVKFRNENVSLADIVKANE